ncbi:hypothetical protein Cob_v000979 [Colletotrichum orbiculare MAFF 240422]|uniref:Uncharacterized protein n=1 Tax=Colletotrichum orbiculare (strain 104-T / ATCC 96160 / CBS 514.97 / LARS 414 / MAFF 240422) TaxID=1213857 RepID=N4W4S7_COLOR|nr:hypothetical protein Cob_v000979 [Colletotrichum orbiculare MAFF 240422]
MLLWSYVLIKRPATNTEWHLMHILISSWARDRMEHVAIGCVKLDELDEAETLLRSVLDASKRVLRRSHLDTLFTMERLAGLLYQKGGDAGSCRASGERIKGRVAELGDYRPHVAGTKAKLGRNKNGQFVAVEVVQWQDGSTDVGDSNCDMQSMKDRYLY